MADTNPKTVTDVTGINVAGIPKIKAAIDDWVNDINSSLTGINSTNTQKAIKGTHSEAELKTLCQSVNSRIKNLTAMLSNLKNELDTVEAGYKNNDENNTAFSNYYNKLDSTTPDIKS